MMLASLLDPQRAAEAGVMIVEKPLMGNGLVETIRGALELARP